MIKATIYTTGKIFEVSMDKDDYTNFILGLINSDDIFETKSHPWGRATTIYIRASKIEAIMMDEDENIEEDQNNED